MSQNIEQFRGKVVKGYELREPLGEGGFGVVYRAFQPSVGRDVAVKIILPEYANQPDFIRRFEAEAQVVARLEHFHIVPLYDYWREPDGAYFVMRWLRGGSIRRLLEDNQPLNVATALLMLEQVGSALTVAHRNNVVHRDLKPDNILLDDDQNAYLADFGIAKILSGDPSRTVAEHALVGSPAYSPPEQIRSEEVTPTADQYSLGVMLYEMLTGFHPFHGHSVTSLIMKHLQEPLPSLREYRMDLPSSLDELIWLATAKDPNARFDSIQTFVANVRQTLAYHDDEATVVGARDRVPNFTSGAITQVPRETLHFSVEIADVENPFKGLRAFQEADASDFFGRETLLDQLIEHLSKGPDRFLGVVGPSGSGKSSAVKAGLLPAVRKGVLPHSDEWFVVEMFPGAFPLEELESSLLRVAMQPVDGLLAVLQSGPDGLIKAAEEVLPPGVDLLLFIDQFEEVFTFVENEADREHLLNMILEATTQPSGRLHIVVTLRADFYDRPLMYPRFGALFRRNTEIVLPLNNEELELAITGPAERAGLTLEPGLVQAIVNDVGEQPGALPLLQYALTELFERREGRQLTVSAYTQIGGALGALARRADELYIRLDDEGQDATRQLFLRLVTLGEGTEDTRRRAVRSELLSLTGEDTAMEAAIDLFSRYRLLTLDRDPATREPTVEVAHEALIRQWNQLRDWLNTSREDLRMQRRLATASHDWQKAQADPSYLATGSQLEQFEVWAAETDIQLSADEVRYLRQSVQQREEALARQAAQEAREAELEKRSRRRLQQLVIVLVTMLLGAVGLTFFAVAQRNIARDSARIAERTRDEAQSIALAVNAKLALQSNDTDLANQLALLATRIDNPPTLAHNALFEAAHTPATILRLANHTDEVNQAWFSPDGRLIITASDDGRVIIWDAAAGTEVQALSLDDTTINAVDVGPAGRFGIAGTQDGRAVIFSTDTAATVRTIRPEVTEGSNAVQAVSLDNPFATVGLQNGEIIIYDAESGDELRRLQTSEDSPAHTSAITRLVQHPVNAQLYSASVDGTIAHWNLNTGRLLGRFIGHEAPVRALAIDTMGEQLLSGAQNGSLVLWNTASGSILREFNTPNNGVWSVGFGSDELLLSGGQDGLLREWRVNGDEPVRVLRGHTDRILSIATRDNRALTASADGTVRLWSLDGDLLLGDFEDTGSTEAGVNDLALSPDGRYLLSGGAFGSLALWDTVTNEVVQRFTLLNTSIFAVAYHSDGRHVFTGAQNGSIFMWDVQTGASVTEFVGHDRAVSDIALNPDSTRLASASQDGSVRISDTADGSELLVPLDSSEAASAVAYSPDGEQLLVGLGNGVLISFDADTGEEQYRVQAHSFSITDIAVQSNTVATASQDTTIGLWNLADGTAIRRLAGHEDTVLSVKFGPAGLLSAAGNPFGPATDNSLRLWDIATGEEVRRFDSPQDEAAVNTVVFSSDGLSAYAADGQSHIYHWQTLPLSQLVAWAAENRYARPLTCGEVQQFRLEQAECN